MKIPFSIEYKEQIESGEYKVKTKSGQEVRIVCWDMNTCNGTLIVALVKGYGGEYEKMRSYTLDGKCKGASEEASLFIHTPEPELTEFEKSIVKLIDEIDSDNAIFLQSYDKYIKEFAPIIMKAAEDEMREKTNGNYAWLVGKEAAYKNMPKWRFVKLGENYPACITREVDDNGNWTYQLSVGKLYNCSHYIPLKELEKLSVVEE